MKRPATLVAIAMGGVLGAGLRWLLLELIPSDDIPWATLVSNVIGCAVLARVTWSSLTVDRKAALGTGVCGGLTTFSGIAVEAVQLFDDGRTAVALLYLVASLLLGLGAYLLARPSVEVAS